MLTRGPDDSDDESDDESFVAESFIEWATVEDLFQYSEYEQASKPIPEAELQFLYQYLIMLAKVMAPHRQLQRMASFVAPVLITPCNLLGTDAKLLVLATVTGNQVHASGHFDCMIKHGSKRICIVETKRNDFWKGAAQALVGSEVVADRCGLSTVYGIVTNFVKWDLYRRSEAKIEKCSFPIDTSNGKLSLGSLREVCESSMA